MGLIGIARAGVVAALLGSAAPAFAQSTEAKLDELFGKTFSASTPGCAVGVSNKGALTTRAYGLADLEHGVPITPETIFESGSVAKQFTAMAILLLEHDRKLRTSDDIRKYLPEMPDYGAPITIDHLLHHTSGLRDWGSVATASGLPRGARVFSQADVLDILKRQKALNYKPGAEYLYTNSGYNLLAEIVARTSGMSFQAFTTERIFKPLGMTHSQWRDDFNKIVKGRAIAYAQRSGQGYVQNMPFMNVLGNGGLLTTVGDWLIWNDALTTAKLGADVTKSMTERSALNDGAQIVYARGLEVQTYKGFNEVAHSGSTAGYTTWLGRYPDQGLSLALLCNVSYPGLGFPRQIADIFLPTTAAPASPAAGLPDPAPYAGVFADAVTGMPSAVSAANGQLRITGAPQLMRQDANHWIGDAGFDVVFDGPNAFRVQAPMAAPATYKRVQPVQPTPTELADYAGAYASDEAGASYKVAVEGGQLVLHVDRQPDATTQLSAAYKDAFTSGGRLIRFRRNAAGKVAAMSLADNRMRDLNAPRVSAK